MRFGPKKLINQQRIGSQIYWKKMKIKYLILITF